MEGWGATPSFSGPICGVRVPLRQSGADENCKAFGPSGGARLPNGSHPNPLDRSSGKNEVKALLNCPSWVYVFAYAWVEYGCGLYPQKLWTIPIRLFAPYSFSLSLFAA